MALTAEQKAFRAKLIGGSDSNVIMSGDAERILKLWKVKRGEEADDDLSDVLQVQMGTFTEPFNGQWFTKNTGRLITNQGEQRICKEYEFMGCTLDGITDGGETIWEAKHVSAFAKEEEVLDKYLPQLHHNMIVCGLEKAVLSVFFGNHKWEKFEVHKDAIYSAILVGAVEKFWACVKSGEPPVAVKVSSPIPAIRTMDMTGNNQWASSAQQFKDNAKYHKLYEDAAKSLKALVEDDVIEAFGYGINIKRDKRGALRIKGE
jgi:predicted phage-related endonuclease